MPSSMLLVASFVALLQARTRLVDQSRVVPAALQLCLLVVSSLKELVLACDGI